MAITKTPEIKNLEINPNSGPPGDVANLTHPSHIIILHINVNVNVNVNVDSI